MNEYDISQQGKIKFMIHVILFEEKKRYIRYRLSYISWWKQAPMGLV